MTEQQTEPRAQDATEQPQEQPQKRPLFRPEAVEAHARARVPTGGRLDLRERRTMWLFRALLVAMALAVVAAFTIHVDRTVSAPAFSAGGGTVEFGLPGRYAGSLRAGQALTVTADGREYPGRITEVESRGGGVVVRAEVPGAPSAPEGDPARATVELDRESVADLLMGRE